ncbi:MAG: hypothetical protein JNL21_16935 [Myxococcales bacterium]|nr:hypothetical protein [Myxococcales bacterium]
MKRILVAVAAVAMPAISYASNLGVFGPDNKTISGRYPTLLIAAGYAFSIWGVIFVLDLVYAGRQLTRAWRGDATLDRIAPLTTGGFALTALWSPLFSVEAFWLCLAVIFGALVCMLTAAIRATRLGAPRVVRIALSLHAGWLCLAAFLNVAQTIVAYELLPAPMLPWSLGLFASAAVLLLLANQRLGGNPAFTFAGVWALVAVFVKQRGSDLEGSRAAAWTAMGIAALLALHTALLALRRKPSPS